MQKSNDGEKYAGGEATERKGHRLQAFSQSHRQKFTPELAVECPRVSPVTRRQVDSPGLVPVTGQTKWNSAIFVLAAH